jgi:uncharacterized protein with GYD domain
MPKYMIQASYTAEGTQGVMAKGGTSRRASAEEAIKSVGGSLESFYFAFGDHDAYLIMDLPDNASAASLALAVNGAGFVRSRTIVLLTPEEMDRATKKKAKYRVPGK